MFLFKEMNESLYRKQKVFNGNDDIWNAVRYCFCPEKWNSDFYEPYDSNIRLAGCSSNFLQYDQRFIPEMVYNTIIYNHRIYNDQRGNFIKHRVLSFEANDLLLPEDLVFLAQYLSDWYSSLGYFTVFGVHLSTGNLHIHLMIDAVSYLDGHRFKISYEYYKVKDVLTLWYISFYQFLLTSPTELQKRLEFLNLEDAYKPQERLEMIQKNIADAIKGNSFLNLPANDVDYYKGQWPYFFMQNGGSNDERE